MKNLSYAGIGSRHTPAHVLIWMREIAKDLSPNWTLRSGHADGADINFEIGCVGNKEIYLPWAHFMGASHERGYVVPPMTTEAMNIASAYHPNWNACTPTVRKMHTRNVYQILGINLDQPCNMVICWTKDGKQGGGTGQALRLANALDIPVFDLAFGNKTLDELSNFVNNHQE